MADHRMSSGEARQRMTWGAGIAIGMGIGVALGTALDNLAVGVALGMLAGIVVVIGAGQIGRSKRRGPAESDADDEADELD